MAEQPLVTSAWIWRRAAQYDTASAVKLEQFLSGVGKHYYSTDFRLVLQLIVRFPGCAVVLLTVDCSLFSHRISPWPQPPYLCTPLSCNFVNVHRTVHV